VAILLASSSVSAQAVTAIGPALLAGEAGVVLISIVASYGAGRLPGLPGRMATLVACANSICGNSANAAAAPVPLAPKVIFYWQRSWKAAGIAFSTARRT
jgi:uncharacterized membrane protein YadS